VKVCYGKNHLDDVAFNSPNWEKFKKLETQFGVHLIEVTEKTDDVKKIKVRIKVVQLETWKRTIAKRFSNSEMDFSINTASD